MGTATARETKTMLTLPGDAVRQIQWRFADRFDLQMLVQSARGVARGTVARLVAAGERNTHEWTAAKSEMMDAFDRAGITAAFMEPEEGGFIAGPKNLALSLAAFELAWVDGGAATASLAGFLGPGSDPRTRHAGADQPLQEPRGPTAARRRSQALARRFRADRAHSLRRCRHRHAERQGARRRVEGRRGAHASGRQARPLHHQHRLRQLRHRSSQTPTIRASRAVASSSSKTETKVPSIAEPPPRSWSTSSPRPAIPSSISRFRPAASWAATPSRMASSFPISITAK